MQTSDWAGAHQSVRRGEEVAGEIADWKLLRAYLAWRQGDLGLAADSLESLLVERPGDATARRILRKINENREEPGTANDPDDYPPT